MRALTTLAFDYDGTLTHTGRLEEPVVGALRRAGAAGLMRVLVTGRVLADLRRVCPESAELFELVVAENGALLADRAGLVLRLAAPIDARLLESLEARGVLAVGGEVLVATEARAEPVVREELARLGIDARLFLNRASLMVLPPGVSKASGLSHALARLGASAAETVAFGDAENDRELLQAVGMGVAVADAVDELKQIADLVLDRPDGLGVAAWMDEVLLGR